MGNMCQQLLPIILKFEAQTWFKPEKINKDLGGDSAEHSYSGKSEEKNLWVLQFCGVPLKGNMKKPVHKISYLRINLPLY